MGQMEELSQKRIQEVRADMADGGKRDDGKGYTDLLTLMGECASFPAVMPIPLTDNPWSAWPAGNLGLR